MAKLVLRTGANAGTEYPIKDARFQMGRRSQSDAPVADAKCSREHAVIHDQSGTLYVQDLSRNGTFVNDKPALKVEPGTALKFGDKIKIGDTVFELIDEKSEPIAIDIPGYTILEKVGLGGMGVVYKAKQISMDRVVALKVLNERYSNNAEFVDRFIREARAAGKLNHPNVIHVHDISRANGRHYFSMEFIDGPSVRELLKQEKRIEVNKAVDIAMQAAKALEFAHGNRIVHRDIKPDNLMLTREGIVKIADLGIAKTFEESGPSGSKEHRGVLGTPHYMAPEQALGKAIDHRVDIYSLGATMYHMITGHTPFSGATAQEILKAHVQTSLPPIQDLNKDAPDPVCFIIERMMAKLPEKRYQNMSLLIEDIERIQTGNIKGIERIESTDSSVLRTVKATPGAAAKDRPSSESVRKKARPRRDSITAEQETGFHIPVHKIVSGVIWIVLLLVAIYAVVQLPKLLAPKPVEPEVIKPEKTKPSKPESRLLMAQANDALNDNNLKKYEMLLLKVKNGYSETIESEKADKLLFELAKSNVENSRQLSIRALEDAKKFESENPQDTAGILTRYKDVLSVSGGNAAAYNEAKAKIDSFEKGADPKQPGPKASGPAKETFDKAAALRAAFDYDGARKMLKDFIYSTQNLEDGAEARSQLRKMDDEAKAKVKDMKDKTAKMEPLAAATEWSKYASTVKDEANAAEVKPILEDLEEKTQTAAMEELGKATEKAKINKYAEATEAVVAMEKKWAGLKWARVAKGKEASYKQQKTLYDSVLKLLGEKAAAGPIPLPFPVQTKFKNQEKWAVAGVKDESISLDPIPSKSAPGVALKLGDLGPKEQYQLVMLVMPKEPTKEQHLQLKAFCTERGLSDEADKHEAKADAAAN